MRFSSPSSAPARKSLTLFTLQCDGVRTNDTSVFAPGLRDEEKALLVAPTAHTWFDGSPNPKRDEFAFPSNRSSASTAPPNRSTSPTHTKTCDSEVDGNVDSLRREMIRLYDCNAELRKQVESLQTGLRLVQHSQIAEYKEQRCTRCAGLEAALEAEQIRCRELDRMIIALREELGKTMWVEAHMANPFGGEKDKMGGTLRECLSREGRQPPVVKTDPSVAHLMLQEEIAMLKAKFIQPLQDSTCESERRHETQTSSTSLDASTRTDLARPQTPSRRQGIRGIRDEDTLLDAHNSQKSGANASPSFQNSSSISGFQVVNEGMLSSLHSMQPNSPWSAIASRSTQLSPSNHVLAPQSLADFSPFTAGPLRGEATQPWYDDDEVRKIVLSSQASRTRLANFPKQLPRESPSVTGSLGNSRI